VPEQLSTVAKTLRVLEAFSFAEPVLGVSELARKLDMGKSTVHRALSTLLEHGYVTKTPDDRYRLGLKLHEMGQLVVSGLRLHEVAHGPLERLRVECKETVHLAVLDGTDVVFVEQMESAGLVRMFNRVGRRVPAHATSSGKCLLAFNESAVELVLQHGLKRRAPRTITSEALLVDALDRIRTLGYSVSVEESEPGVASVGAPVFGRDGSCIAAVAMAGPALRLGDEHLLRSVRQVRRCAAEISEAMGFRERRSRGA
jgi:IclR family transcriptional regulator, KDG regulon repressor